MDALFLGNAMALMDAHRQMQFQQQMDMQYNPHHKRSNTYPTVIYQNRPFREKYYENNEFNQTEQISMFDTIEVYDPIVERNSCYIKCEEKNKTAVTILVEISHSYKDIERAKQLIQAMILDALQQGYQTISAIIGNRDEVGKELLIEMGFVMKSQEEINER